MRGRPKNTVNKVSQSKEEQTSTVTHTVKRRKLNKDEIESSTESVQEVENKNSNSTGQSVKKSRVHRSLESALELDKKLNNDRKEQEEKEQTTTKPKSVAESLMYTILPGNSKFVKQMLNKTETKINDGIKKSNLNVEMNDNRRVNKTKATDPREIVLVNKTKEDLNVQLIPNKNIYFPTEKGEKTAKVKQQKCEVLQQPRQFTPFKVTVDPGEENKFLTDSEDEDDKDQEEGNIDEDIRQF